MSKKTLTLSIVIGVIVFLLVCTAESLIALRKAIKERDAAAQKSDDTRCDSGFPPETDTSAA